MASLRMRDMEISVNTINSILEQEDIEGYINLGAPSNEYASEAADIAAAISQLDDSEITEGNIMALLALKWMENFNLSESDISQRTEALRRVTKTLMQEIR